MYRLYIGNKNYSSWSLRPWILMRELGIPFEERLVPFQEEGSSWASFRMFSPTGRVPCLHDGGTVIWDSLGIVEYLAERHAGAWPADRAARAWARCAAAEMHSGFETLRRICTMNCGIRVRLAAIPPELESEIARVGELWNEGLERFGGPFLAGRTFTAVDAFFAPVVLRAQTYGLELAPSAAEYAARMLERPAIQAWQAEALAETWREPGHEAEVRAAGRVIADLRAALGTKAEARAAP
jgi:glutathione S-transferase